MREVELLTVRLAMALVVMYPDIHQPFYKGRALLRWNFMGEECSEMGDSYILHTGTESVIKRVTLRVYLYHVGAVDTTKNCRLQSWTLYKSVAVAEFL